MPETLETLLAYYCAPAFAGIKPSNIATIQKSQMPNLHGEIDRLNKELNSRDIYIEILCECERHALVMVYRKSVLQKHLSRPGETAFLVRCGYSLGGSFADYMSKLKSRLGCDNFPHEIGVFLGYPLRDIYCFVNHRNRGCLMVGEWRVYHNSEEAAKMFSRFKACRAALVRMVTQRGKTLAQIFCAA